MKRCNCHQCRARDDRAFWAIVAPLEAAEWVDPLGVRTGPWIERIREYTDAPRARTPEDFEQWLSRIIDRAQRRKG